MESEGLGVLGLQKNKNQAERRDAHAKKVMKEKLVPTTTLSHVRDTWVALERMKSLAFGMAQRPSSS